MQLPSESSAANEVAELLTEWFTGQPAKVRLRNSKPDEGYDFQIEVSGHSFLAEYKRSTPPGLLNSGIAQVKKAASRHTPAVIPLLVVPYMGETGQRLCEQQEIGWLDLSGNARITAPGLLIRIEGRPNKFIERGRPPNVFAPKSSRVARQLLLNSERFQTQTELARATGLGDGYVSKIARRLAEEKYVDTNAAGALRPQNPDLMLDAWHAAYDFDHHHILRGHVPARSSDELLERITNQFSREKLDWAATGLAAAWLYNHFASFRLVTVYLATSPSRSFLKSLDFSDEPKGANLWLVVPDDEGVFHGQQSPNNIPCVSPLQTYLDLKSQPERATDAAAELRKQNLDWKRGSHGQ